MMNKRKLLAIIVAPLMPAIAIIGESILTTMSWPFNQTDYKLIILSSVVMSCLGLLIFGFPGIKILQKRSMLSLINLGIYGAVCGTFVFIVFLLGLGFFLNSTGEFSVGSIIGGAVLGSLVAITYGLISGITNRSRGAAQNVAN